MSHTLKQAAAHFGKLAAGGYKQALSPLLTYIGTEIKDEIQKEIGEINGSIGQYPTTEPLSMETVFTKAKEGWGKGSDPFSPLWATGALHDSIGFAPNVAALTVEIGSNEADAKYHELGTISEPPRPIFAPAVLRRLPKLLPTISKAAGMGVMGGVWQGLSADGKVQAGGQFTANIAP